MFVVAFFIMVEKYPFCVIIVIKIKKLFDRRFVLQIRFF